MKSLTQFLKEDKSANGEKVSLEDFLTWFTGFVQEYDEEDHMSSVWFDFDDVLDSILEAGKKAKKFNNFSQFLKFCEKHADDTVTLKETPSTEEKGCYDYSFDLDGVHFEFTMCGRTYPNDLYH